MEVLIQIVPILLIMQSLLELPIEMLTSSPVHLRRAPEVRLMSSIMELHRSLRLLREEINRSLSQMLRMTSKDFQQDTIPVGRTILTSQSILKTNLKEFKVRLEKFQNGERKHLERNMEWFGLTLRQTLALAVDGQELTLNIANSLKRSLLNSETKDLMLESMPQTICGKQ